MDIFCNGFFPFLNQISFLQGTFIFSQTIFLILLLFSNSTTTTVPHSTAPAFLPEYSLHTFTRTSSVQINWIHSVALGMREYFSWYTKPYTSCLLTMLCVLTLNRPHPTDLHSVPPLRHGLHCNAFNLSSFWLTPFLPNTT